MCADIWSIAAISAKASENSLKWLSAEMYIMVTLKIQNLKRVSSHKKHLILLSFHLDYIFHIRNPCLSGS